VAEGRIPSLASTCGPPTHPKEKVKMIMGKKSTEPLMTLPELSEMLGVPIETL